MTTKPHEPASPLIELAKFLWTCVWFGASVCAIGVVGLFVTPLALVLALFEPKKEKES